MLLSAPEAICLLLTGPRAKPRTRSQSRPGTQLQNALGPGSSAARLSRWWLPAFSRHHANAGLEAAPTPATQSSPPPAPRTTSRPTRYIAASATGRPARRTGICGPGGSAGEEGWGGWLLRSCTHLRGGGGRGNLSWSDFGKRRLRCGGCRGGLVFGMAMATEGRRRRRRGRGREARNGKAVEGKDGEQRLGALRSGFRDYDALISEKEFWIFGLRCGERLVDTCREVLRGLLRVTWPGWCRRQVFFRRSGPAEEPGPGESCYACLGAGIHVAYP